jgi:hypothetical protein
MLACFLTNDLSADADRIFGLSFNIWLCHVVFLSALCLGILGKDHVFLDDDTLDALCFRLALTIGRHIKAMRALLFFFGE